MKPITLGPKPEQRESQLAAVCRFIMSAHLGKPINIKITIARPERTGRQLGYLFGVAYRILVEEKGYTDEGWHEYFCIKFFGGKEVGKPGGRVEAAPIRTTTKDADGNRDVIDRKTFWDFVEMIQREAAEGGVYIPDPEG